MAWDKTEPAASSYLQSADLRSNWEAIDESLHGVNLLADPSYLIWPEGDAADPAHWALSGTAAVIGRETSIRKYGAMCAKVTYGSAAAYLDQDILPSGDYDDGFDGEDFSAGCWVYSDVADTTIGIEDGSDTSYSDNHSGTSVWEWMTVTHTIDSSATAITYRQKLNAAGSAFYSWPTVIKGSIPPQKPLWPRATRANIGPILAGNPVTAGTEVWAGTFSRPFIVDDVQIECITAVGGQAFIVDVNQWDGSAWVSMFSTKPEVAVAAQSGGAQPDTTYQYRCFKAGFGATTDYARIGIDVDQAAGSAGKNPTVFIRAISFARPAELLLGYNSIK